MSRKQENMSKVSAWISTDIYKEARKMAIDKDIRWRDVLEKGLHLYLEDCNQKKISCSKEE